MPVQFFWCEATTQKVSFEECLHCAKSWEQECSLIYPIIDFLVKDIKEKRDRDGEVHVTDLTSACIRQVIMKKFVDYGVYPSSRTYVMDGTLVHSFLEEYASPEDHSELGLELKLPGDILLVGKCDNLAKQRILIDYKTSRNIMASRLPRDEHVWQINIYRYMIENPNIYPPVEKCLLIYKDMNGPQKCRTCKGKLIPDSPGVMICSRGSCRRVYRDAHNGMIIKEAELLPLDEVRDYIHLRAGDIAAYLFGKDKVIPAMPESLAGWVCQYCDVAYICQAMGPEERKLNG